MTNACSDAELWFLIHDHNPGQIRDQEGWRVQAQLELFSLCASVVSMEDMDRQQPTSPEEKKSPALRHFTSSEPLRTYENRPNHHMRPLNKLGPKKLRYRGGAERHCDRFTHPYLHFSFPPEAQTGFSTWLNCDQCAPLQSPGC
ncbi:hypothetical protein INR49_018027 [Caranx melampygus]|nr:hypothetical protein INR49_018027 [Caranx melampygus]